MHRSTSIRLILLPVLATASLASAASSAMGGSDWADLMSAKETALAESERKAQEADRCRDHACDPEPNRGGFGSYFWTGG